MGTQIESWLDVTGELSYVELRLLETAVLLAALIVIRTLLFMLLRRQIEDERVRYHWRKGLTYALAFIGLFVLGRIWFVGFRSIATFLGIAAAGFVIALKEPALERRRVAVSGLAASVRGRGPHPDRHAHR